MPSSLPPSHGSLVAAKQKQFNIPKTCHDDHRHFLSTILEELLGWRPKKELQIGLVYRYARTKSGVIEKEPTAVQNNTYNHRNQGKRALHITEFATSSNPTGRLLSAQTAEDDINPVLTTRRDIWNHWKCMQKDCEINDDPEPVCYVKDSRRHYPIAPQDLASWSAAIPKERPGRITNEQLAVGLVVAWDRKWKKKMKNEAREEKNEREEEDIQRTRDYVPPPTATPATMIIQLSPWSTHSTGALADIRSSRLEAELVARGYCGPQRSISHAYSRGVTSAPEQRASSPVHVDLEEFTEDIKLNAPLHDQRALEDAGQKLLDRHYKSHYMQKWKDDEYEERWERLAIEPGIERDLADNIGANGRRKQQARALTHIHSPAVSTSRTSKSVLDPIEDESVGHRQQQEEEEELEGEFDLSETTFEGDKDSS